MDDTTLTIDANHELAGQAVSMEVTLVAAMDPAERFPDKRTDAEWKEQLGEFEYHVLRMKGTEAGGTGEYDKVRSREPGSTMALWNTTELRLARMRLTGLVVQRLPCVRSPTSLEITTVGTRHNIHPTLTLSVAAWRGGKTQFYPESGYFTCAGCEQPLYTAQSKFDSGCGWPVRLHSTPQRTTARERERSRAPTVCLTLDTVIGILGH